MSFNEIQEPDCEHHDDGVLTRVIEARERLLDTFPVRRARPAARRRMVGPFIFFDHFGPVTIPPGRHGGMDVRPHPHIALATVSYLMAGEILHRDSLGSERLIRPGDVNWMSAGRGIVHSERTRPDALAKGFDLHGLQSWVALPRTHEESEPVFEHHPAATLPVVEQPGVTLRVVAGTAYGQTSPVGVVWPTLYVHAQMAAGASLAIDDEHAERAVYVVDGTIGCHEREFGPGTMVVLSPGARVTIQARTTANVMLLGGATMDGSRFIEWNFVSSSRERIEQAKDDWREGRFPRVPGDEVDFIPLPE